MNMRLLIVDDDEMTLELLTAILEDAGYSIVSAANAVDACHVLLQWPDIGLVVCDMQMPVIDGVDFCRTLREQGKNLPFILLTGDEPDLARVNAAAINAWLLKDYDLDTCLPQLVADTLSGVSCQP